MSNLRQTAQKALEALTLVETDKWAAIDALRAALAEPDRMTPKELAKRLERGEKWELAEPEQEPVFDCPRCGHCCPQTEQEPVASCNGMPAYEGTLSKIQRTQLTQDLDAPLTINGVALYPNPPQRKPLTDEELRDTLRQCPHDTVENLRVRWLYAKDFARAIEAAHGIKGKV